MLCFAILKLKQIYICVPSLICCLTLLHSTYFNSPLLVVYQKVRALCTLCAICLCLNCFALLSKLESLNSHPITDGVDEPLRFDTNIEVCNVFCVMHTILYAPRGLHTLHCGIIQYVIGIHNIMSLHTVQCTLEICSAY